MQPDRQPVRKTAKKLKTGMLTIALRLKALKKSWQGLGVAQRNLAAIGMPDRDSRFVEDMIDWLDHMASELAFSPVSSNAMAKRSCEEQLMHLEAFFSDQHTENRSLRMLGFISILLQMKILLRSALEQSAELREGQNRKIA